MTATTQAPTDGRWPNVNRLYVIIPLIFLTLCFLIPLAKLFYLSLFQVESVGVVGDSVSLANYARFLGDFFYLKILLVSVGLGFASTVICVIMGYPVAYKIARTRGRARALVMACVVLPLWVSITIRMFGWMAVLTQNGLINSLLKSLHLVDNPATFIGTYLGVLAGLVHCGLPFMIMTLISPIENVSPDLENASYVFGGGFWYTFFRVVLPLTVPGIFSASLLVFALNTAAFMVPMMLGGGKIVVMTTLMYQQALFVYDWPFTAAIAVILMITSMTLVVVSRRLARGSKMTF